MTGPVAGVDGGGSRTRAAVFAPGSALLARAEGPGSAIDPTDPVRSAETVASVVRRAAGEAGVPLPLAALHVGLAGAGRPGPRDRVLERLRSLGLAHRVTLGTDAEAAFHDAFASGPGILVVAGTGSMILGRNPGGATARVGGWGPVLGDEGSGWDLGRSALRAVARAEDGLTPPTGLRDLLLSATGGREPGDLVLWAAGADRASVAALAQAVAQADRAGDPTAGAILDRAAGALARGVEVLVDRLGPWPDGVPVALTGGLLGAGAPLRARMEGALGAWAGGLRAGPVDAARGAATLARESALQG